MARLNVRTAQAGGAKLIVLDPRKSENAEAADIWLPPRTGPDAAKCAPASTVVPFSLRSAVWHDHAQAGRVLWHSRGRRPTIHTRSMT